MSDSVDNGAPAFELPTADQLIGSLDDQLAASMSADMANVAPASNEETPLFPNDPDEPPQSIVKPPAEPATPPAPEATPQQLDGMRGYMQQQGFDVSGYQDDQQLLSDLHRLHSNRQQLEQYASIGMQVAPEYDRYQQWLNEQTNVQQQPAQQPAQPQAEPEPEPSPFESAWKAPKFDPGWMKLVEFDERTNEYVAAHPTVSREVVDGVNTAVDFLRNQQRDYFLGNPYQQMWEVQQEPLNKLIEEKAQAVFEAKMAEQQKQNDLLAFEQNNAPWIYQMDQTGNPVINPQTGQPNFTQAGVRFSQLFNELTQTYPQNDPRDVARHAQQMVQGELARVHLTEAQRYAQAQQELNAQQQGQEQPQGAPAQMPALPPEQMSANRISAVVNGNSQAAFHYPSANGAAQMPPEAKPVRNFQDLDDWFLHASRQGLGIQQ